MDRDLLTLMGLHPFDPKVNQPVPLPGGSVATEYTGTWQDDQGRWFVAPQIWWGPDGQPAFLGEDRGRDMALLYEQMGNAPFPRFNALAQADAYAAARSHGGGGQQGSINALAGLGR
jgi:hypothetical protein